MAITLLSDVITDSKYSAFYSSLITSGHLSTITWEELVPMMMDQEEQFVKSSDGPSDKDTKGAPLFGYPKERF